jgi:hypothetical protein
MSEKKLEILGSDEMILAVATVSKRQMGFKKAQKLFNLLKPSGNFTYDQV